MEYLSLQFVQWNKKWLEKIWTNLNPRENSLLRELKKRKILLITLICRVEEIWNTLKIYKVTLYYIFLSSLRRYESGALL